MKKTILELVEEYELDIHKEGSILRAFCPFHDDTNKPNFTIYETTNSWFCFSCNEGGDAISFLAKIEQISRKQALERLKNTDIELEELQQKLDGAEAANTNLPSFNTELDVVLSHHCKKYLQTHSEKIHDILMFFKQLDALLFSTISYEKMQSLLKEIKQKFPLEQTEKVLE